VHIHDVLDIRKKKNTYSTTRWMNFVHGMVESLDFVAKN